MRIAVLAILLLACSCEAAFTDLRPDPETTGPDATAANNGVVQDMGVAQSNAPGDMESDPDATGDAAGGPDSGSPTEDMAPAMDTVVASGMFVPRANYGGEGTAELVQLADGSWELQIGADFQVGSVPGPVVVLAREDSLGSTLDPGRGDMELGVLETNNGASSYPLPAPPDDRRIVWIYCKPFGLQMTSAQLEDQ